MAVHNGQVVLRSLAHCFFIVTLSIIPVLHKSPPKSPNVGKTSPQIDLYIVFNRTQQAATPGVTTDTYFIGSKKESKMKVTTPKLIRWAGLSAVVAGIIFTAVQPAHPPFNTSTFIIISYMWYYPEISSNHPVFCYFTIKRPFRIISHVEISNYFSFIFHLQFIP